MQSRMKHPVFVLPEAMQAMQALSKAAEKDGLPLVTRKLVELRASQINGCSVCVDMHARELQKAGEPDKRIFAVAAWREVPYFTEAERAALALTEAATRIADRADPVPDDIWLAVGADPRHRHHQRLEPAQRRGQAGCRCGVGVMAQTR